MNMPSWQAFVSDLVPREDLQSAVTLNSLQFNAARAIGPGLAGLLLALLGPGWAFGLNALSYLFVIGALLAVRARSTRVPEPTSQGVLRQFVEAVGYAWTQPGLVVVMIVSVLVGVLGNPVFSFTVVFAAAVYYVGPVGLGLLNVAFGIGAVAAAPVVSGWRRELPLSALVRWGLVGYGLTMIVFGATTVFVIGALALVAIGACFLAVISGVNTSLQLYVDEQYRGRVMALRLMVFTLSFPIGGLVQGALADRIGPQQTVVGAGVAMLVAALVLGGLRGRLRLGQLDGPALGSSSG
jgi:predicted MFS family arabinose efflux permease